MMLLKCSASSGGGLRQAVVPAARAMAPSPDRFPRTRTHELQANGRLQSRHSILIAVCSALVSVAGTVQMYPRT